MISRVFLTWIYKNSLAHFIHISSTNCKQTLYAKALDDRKGSRSNDNLDHILGKKDRNWLHF